MITKKEVFQILQSLSMLDYGEPLPKIDDFFLKVWTNHYYRIARILPGMRMPEKILEIGIGYGVLALLLRKVYHCSVFATEHPSRKYLRSVDFTGLMNKEGIQIVEHDLYDPIPFADETFDIVLFCDVMEHLPPDLLACCFAEIKRITKDGGSLILSTPNLARLPNRLRFLKGYGINPPPLPVQVGETFDHIREYTLDEIEDFLRGQFRISKREFETIPFFNKKYNVLNSLFSIMFRKFRDEIYIRAEVIRA